MDPIPGFVFVPRPAGSAPAAGAFFSAVVPVPPGPGLPLPDGEELRTALVAAFLSRGLPTAAQALDRWVGWSKHSAAPWDQAGWASSLEARGWGPDSPPATALEPWLAWQTALENGKASPPPDEDGFWDLWNSRRPQRGDPWLVLPLRWEWKGHQDAGLLQAHWNTTSQSIDAWHLTAAPGGTGFRLEARPSTDSLALTWRFFQGSDQGFWDSRVATLAEALSRPDFAVTLKVVGPRGPGPGSGSGSLDVEA